MKNKYRNLFLIFGIAAILIMALSFSNDYNEIINKVNHAGYWFLAVVAIWLLIYLLNTLSWYVILCDKKENHTVPFWKLYKLTISGFALNYATPVGLMGGEPYRIMELTPHVGVERATSSVILFVMMHIFSHFCFWLFSIFLYCTLYPLNYSIGIPLLITALLCSLAIYFFMKGYKNGMAIRALKLASRLPFLKEWSKRFLETKADKLAEIDKQIRELHGQRKTTFYTALALEFLARIVGCIEIYFILHVITNDANFANCILIMAFTSLFSNLFFFSPMQLGAREGGFALAVAGLSIPAAFGIYTGIITRLREFIWIVIGVLLMRIGNKSKNNKKRTKTDK
ncbi:MAG: lysylphosphatidylglycerol synthase transmembrane domain-containing protein [Phocaeicola sp.]